MKYAWGRHGGTAEQTERDAGIRQCTYIDPKSTDAYKNTLQKYDEESQKLERTNGRLYSSYNNLKKKVEEYQKNNKLVLAMQNLQKLLRASVGASHEEHWLCFKERRISRKKHGLCHEKSSGIYA